MSTNAREHRGQHRPDAVEPLKRGQRHARRAQRRDDRLDVRLRRVFSDQKPEIVVDRAVAQEAGIAGREQLAHLAGRAGIIYLEIAVKPESVG